MKLDLASNEYAPLHATYVALVAHSDDILDTLRHQREELADLAAEVPATREGHRYGPGKWSIREVVGHMADAERIFGYRALCVARGEQASLPAFDENTYAAHSPADRRTLRDLLGELLALREANLAMLRALDAEAWTRAGRANEAPVTVRGLAYVMAGHAAHHLQILRDRYGVVRGGLPAESASAAT